MAARLRRLAAAPARSAEILIQRTVKPVVISDYSGFEFKNGGTGERGRARVSSHHRGRGRARCAHRRRQHPRARPDGDRESATARCLTRTAWSQLDASCMHGPKKRAGGGGGDRGCAHAVARREGGDGLHRSPSARRQRGAGVRPRHGLHDRGRSQHRELAPAVARVEATSRSGALAGSQSPARKPMPKHERDPARSLRRSPWCATDSFARAASGARSTATASRLTATFAA